MTVRKRKTRTSAAPDHQQQSLLDVAESMIEQLGFSNLNVDRVAESAGISRRTFYRRFPSKDDLLIALFERVAKQAMKQIDHATAGLDPQETVVEAFTIAARWAELSPIKAEMILRRQHVISNMVTHMEAEVTEWVAAALRKSGAKMPEADLMAVSEILTRLVVSFAERPDSSQVDIRNADSVREYAKRYLTQLVW
ncbi:TetR/AcrR family transcriptional regulator [Gordonia sp. CPCC 205333]|uniref:TetR/AcrR family transcriptional regulator n=1 Tax=Gordonia sp. CPCC 205333 TaxID=3140790 RepID=UPI003AF3C9D4